MSVSCVWECAQQQTKPTTTMLHPLQKQSNKHNPLDTPRNSSNTGPDHPRTQPPTPKTFQQNPNIPNKQTNKTPKTITTNQTQDLITGQAALEQINAGNTGVFSSL